MGRLKYSFYIIIFLVFAGKASAQHNLADSLIRRGDAFHVSYDFENAINSYGQALDILEDSLSVPYDSLKILDLRDKLLLSENGRNMSEYAYSPLVIARHKFSIDDFFLYYPLPDKSWREVPNQLDTATSQGFVRALYAPEDSQSLFFSAEDQDGIRNIYATHWRDTIWTYPSLLNEHMTSPFDEIYPMVSDDGKQMYFASEGLYGVGGFDIYVSEWSDEDKDWSTPVNMGFPYSSPADDFLFINTPDGEYTIFASNRDCSTDSVWVYVLEFDNMPVRRSVDNPARIREISFLTPVESEETLNETDVFADMPENVDTKRYMDQMAQVRALRDSVDFYLTGLDKERNLFALSNDDLERERLTGEILRKEALIPQFQDSLDKAIAVLQKIEMEFLFSGVVIDPNIIMEEADKEVVGEATTYAFTKMNMGDSLSLRMMEPQKKFDYSFMVLDEGQFAFDNTIPAGVIYQIQIFSSSLKAEVSSLKGLSPVFESRSTSGRYTYRVGLFNTYKDVLSKLNTVKKVGFRNAYIVAFIDGKEVSVSKARAQEQKKLDVLYRIEIISPDGSLNPAVSSGIRQQAPGKDIARSETADGRTAYILGNFTEKSQVDALIEFIKAMGMSEVSCISVVNDDVNK